MSNSPYLSVRMVAVTLRMTLKTAYKLLSKDEIPGAFRLGGKWLIDREVFESRLKEKATRSKAPVSRPGSKDRHGLG